MNGIKLLLLPIAVALMAVCSSATASASPITYSEQAVINGTLGDISFAGQTITISWTGDTTNVVDLGGFFTNTAAAGAVSVAITTVGSAFFTDSTSVFVNQLFLPAAAGFNQLSLGGTILATFDNAFATYGLTTPIGPITNSAFIRPDLAFGTTLGLLTISAIRDTSTFTAGTAVPVPVPEPATLTMLGLGLAGLLVRARRRA